MLFCLHSGFKDDIVCRRDGGLRLQEPGSGENLSCVVVFILVLLILCYLLHNLRLRFFGTTFYARSELYILHCPSVRPF